MMIIIIIVADSKLFIACLLCLIFYHRMIVLISSLKQLWQIDLFRIVGNENISPDWTSFSALNFNATAVLSYSWPDGSEPVQKVLGLSFIRAFYGQFMPESGYKIRMSPANDVLIAINTNRSAIVIKGSISKCSANESQAKRHCTFNFWPHICASGTEAELVDWLLLYPLQGNRYKLVPVRSVARNGKGRPRQN